MYIISIKNEDYNLILSLVKDSELRKNIETKRCSIGLKNIEAEFSKSELQHILDILTFKLTELGLDKDSEPNSLGIKIEGLIDLFSAHLYK